MKRKNYANVTLCISHDTLSKLSTGRVDQRVGSGRKFWIVIFTARLYTSAVCCRRRVYMCVCLSVTFGIVSKRLNRGSRKQRHMIARGLEVSDAKDLYEI